MDWAVLKPLHQLVFDAAHVWPGMVSFILVPSFFWLLVHCVERNKYYCFVLTRSKEMVRKMALKKCQLGIFSTLLLLLLASLLKKLTRLATAGHFIYPFIAISVCWAPFSPFPKLLLILSLFAAFTLHQ